MLPKFFASWLVVLIVVPFTAPFSVCDLTGLFGNSRGHHAPVVPRRSTAFRSDTVDSLVPRISTAGRVRLLPLSRAALTPTTPPAPSARVKWPDTSPGHFKDHTVLTTILRL